VLIFALIAVPLWGKVFASIKLKHSLCATPSQASVLAALALLREVPRILASSSPKRLW
jgi:hypothetical protein